MSVGPGWKEHLGLKVLYVSSLHPHCLQNVLDLWNVYGLFFLFLFWSLQEFPATVLMVDCLIDWIRSFSSQSCSTLTYVWLLYTAFYGIGMLFFWFYVGIYILSHTMNLREFNATGSGLGSCLH